ncbi:MAG: proline dehydrogenase [Candidatus Paceibacteria bacterium]|jgi:proline dehydrogenase
MLHKLMIGLLPLVPRPLMRLFAKKYIAGETQDQALAKLQELAERGFPGIFDILGEGSGSEEHARAAAQSYREGASAIAEAGLDAYISIKPTHLGLSGSEELALELYREVARHCDPIGIFMRVEMEDHPTTDATLRIFEALRTDGFKVGIVLQSRLFRTLDDIAQMAPGHLDVRLVKGIYIEPESIAHTDPEAIRLAFIECTEALAQRPDVRLRFATHDAGMAEDLIRIAGRNELSNGGYEFQVLLGVQQELWQTLKSRGHIVRVYVPFGPEWRKYSQRRLSKNPDLFNAVLRDSLPF